MQNLRAKIDSATMEGFIAGFVAVYNNVDKVGDVFLENAFNASIKKWNDGEMIPSDYNHSTTFKKNNTPPIVLTLNVSKLENATREIENISGTKEIVTGLYFELTIDKNIREMYPVAINNIVEKYNAGTLQASVTYKEKNSYKENGIKYITNAELLLVSIIATDIGATNPKAKIIKMKSMDANQKIDLKNVDGVMATKNWMISNGVQPKEAYKWAQHVINNLVEFKGCGYGKKKLEIKNKSIQEENIDQNAIDQSGAVDNVSHQPNHVVENVNQQIDDLDFTNVDITRLLKK